MTALLAAVHLSSNDRAVLALVGAIWLAIAVMIAAYGHYRGYAWLPLFVCCLVPGFWPVVLLVVTVAPNRREQRDIAHLR